MPPPSTGGEWRFASLQQSAPRLLRELGRDHPAVDAEGGAALHQRHRGRRDGRTPDASRTLARSRQRRTARADCFFHSLNQALGTSCAWTQASDAGLPCPPWPLQASMQAHHRSSRTSSSDGRPADEAVAGAPVARTTLRARLP